MGNSVTDKWSGVWPNQLPGYNLGYYAPMRRTGLPHSHAALHRRRPCGQHRREL